MIRTSELKDAIKAPHEVENGTIRAIAHELLDKRDVLMLRNQEYRRVKAVLNSTIRTLADTHVTARRMRWQRTWLGAYAFLTTLMLIAGWFYGF